MTKAPRLKEVLLVLSGSIEPHVGDMHRGIKVGSQILVRQLVRLGGEEALAILLYKGLPATSQLVWTPRCD